MMLDKFSVMRQSHDMKVSTNVLPTNANRDSDKGQLADYSIDVQLSDNKKKMLEAFKVSSGYYNSSPKKNQSPTKQKNQSPKKQCQPSAPVHQVPRIYLFGHKEGDYLIKETDKQNRCEIAQSNVLKLSTIVQSKPNTYSKGKQNKIQELADTCARSTQSKYTSSQNKHQQFLKQVFHTLGLISQNDQKLQFSYLLDSAYARFVDMKSNGRWDLIQKYFKGEPDDLTYSCAINTRSIMKKKSMKQTQNPNENKKSVKVVEPDTASQLIRTKFKLAEDLQVALEKLTKGFTFQKYCYGMQKVQQTKVYLSYDLRCLAWQVKEKEPNLADMSNYNGITDGPRSKNYQKYLNRNYPIDEQLAFSIMLKNRTLDLMAPTVEYKQDFIECMKFTKSFV